MAELPIKNQLFKVQTYSRLGGLLAKGAQNSRTLKYRKSLFPTAFNQSQCFRHIALLFPIFTFFLPPILIGAKVAFILCPFALFPSLE